MFSSKLQDIISTAFNDEVLLCILRKQSGLQDVEIKNVEIRDSATNKGDSYLSTVVRFSVSGIAHEKDNEEIHSHVIVKTLPTNIARRITFRSTVFFKNEVAFYNDVWSVLLDFQKAKNVKNPFLNVPICYSALADGENDYVALEDLNCQEFIPFCRQGEMSYDSVRLVIRLFARFHALSFAFKDQHPEKFKQIAACLEETYFHERYRDWYKDFQKKTIAISKDAVEQELPPKYLKIFNEVIIGNDLYGKMCELASDSDAPLSLITQGDAWVPNFLCRYDSDNLPVEIKLIDFQLTRCTSPVTDITFFLYVCTSYDLLVKHLDDIMMEYHQHFTDFLSELGSSPDIFSFHDFKEDFKKNSIYGIGMAIEALPFQMMDDSETADLDGMQGTEALPITAVWKVHPIKNAVGRQRIANVFKHAADNGFI